MPARTVRCQFKNLTDETLELESEHLDFGIYTGSWTPPKTIAARGVGEWRTESDGFMQGTEGRARYRVPSGEGSEFIDLWWDNPFYGGNKSSLDIVEDFTGRPSHLFEGAHYIDGSPPPNLEKMADGDVEAWVDAVLFPPYVVANANFAHDANATFAIRRKAQVSNPLFGPKGTGPRTSKINTSRKPAQWEGLWASNAVSITIVSLGGGNLSANVTDTTANPAIQLQETFRLNQSGWGLNVFALGILRELKAVDQAAASAVVRATAKAASLQRAKKRERVAAAIHESVLAELNEETSRISKAQLARATLAAAAVATRPKWTVLLSQGVCLTLYDDFEDGRKVGGHMLYERMIPSLGFTLASERLSFYPLLR